MLGPALRKLLEISSPATTRADVPADIPQPLRTVLRERNGFFGFYSALHVRTAAAGIDGTASIREWTVLEVWSRFPQRLPSDLFLFAEDVLANQFGLAPDGSVLRLDVETGDVAHYAPTLELWAANILIDHRFETGWPVAQQWQNANRPLRPGERLVPKLPLVLGGDVTHENLRALPEAIAAAKYATLASTISAVPDGAQVTIDF